MQSESRNAMEESHRTIQTVISFLLNDFEFLSKPLRAVASKSSREAQHLEALRECHMLPLILLVSTMQKETYLAFVLDKVEESIVAQADQISALSEERDRLDMALQAGPRITPLSRPINAILMDCRKLEYLPQILSLCMVWLGRLLCRS